MTGGRRQRAAVHSRVQSGAFRRGGRATKMDAAVVDAINRVGEAVAALGEALRAADHGRSELRDSLAALRETVQKAQGDGYLIDLDAITEGVGQ